MKSMPTAEAPAGFEIGQTVTVTIPPRKDLIRKITLPAKDIKVTISRFATNTYFTNLPKGELCIEVGKGSYYPLSSVKQ